ncbi:MAG: hypothetical protein R3F11_16005 [Verrucomicrobiales bacterium]
MRHRDFIAVRLPALRREQRRAKAERLSEEQRDRSADQREVDAAPQPR